MDAVINDLKVRVFREEDGSWAAACSSLGVYAVGKTIEEVRRDFAEALDQHLSVIREKTLSAVAAPA